MSAAVFCKIFKIWTEKEHTMITVGIWLPTVLSEMP